MKKAEEYIVVGNKFTFANRVWCITRIKCGRVYFKSEGLKEQSADWLWLVQRIEKGGVLVAARTITAPSREQTNG
jgi:hypothetical protein